MKNTVISMLVIICLAAIGYTYFLHTELSSERKLTIEHSKTADSLRMELEKLNNEVQESYNKAEQAYLKSQQELEEARRLAAERESKKKN